MRYDMKDWRVEEVMMRSVAANPGITVVPGLAATDLRGLARSQNYVNL